MFYRDKELKLLPNLGSQNLPKNDLEQIPASAFVLKELRRDKFAGMTREGLNEREKDANLSRLKPGIPLNNSSLIVNFTLVLKVALKEVITLFLIIYDKELFLVRKIK